MRIEAFILLGGLLSLTACGTTYAVPRASDVHTQAAAAMFAEERNPQTSRAGQRLSPAAARRQFSQVVARVEPAAERFCRQETVDRKNFDCDIKIEIDDRASFRNAYQTYGANDEIIVGFTLPMIMDARNPDELAFVMGHEMGHHIGQHISKQQQQAIAGALIMGAITAYGQASANSTNPYRYRGNDQHEMNRNVALGMGAGQAAYSQTYELESDVIGTAIAKMAGYDPVKGARYFARPEETKMADGSLSFWGTHPPDAKRIATVLATLDGIEANGGIARKTYDR